MTITSKIQRPLSRIPQLKFEGIIARVELGGVQIKCEDGFLLPDEAEALHEWLTRALVRPFCAKHEWFHTGNGKYRCARCRVDRP